MSKKLVVDKKSVGGRTIYYVDVGRVTPEEAFDVIRCWRRQLEGGA